MEHPKEEELIAYHDGDRTNRERPSRDRQSPDWRRTSDHLNSCAECRVALEKSKPSSPPWTLYLFPTPAKITANASGPPSPHACRNISRAGGKISSLRAASSPLARSLQSSSPPTSLAVGQNRIRQSKSSTPPNP